jgi:hypothetical protein
MKQGVEKLKCWERNVFNCHFFFFFFFFFYPAFTTLYEFEPPHSRGSENHTRTHHSQ